MLTTLRRIALEFSQNSDLETALNRIVTQVKTAMKTDCCSIHLADYQQQHFILMASDGLAKSSIGQTTIQFSEGLVGLVGQREEPLNIANARQHPHFIHAPEVQEDELNAFLGTPIIHQRKVLGILSIQQKEARYFNETEEAFLVTLAAQIASALSNAEARGALIEGPGSNQWLRPLQGLAGSSGVASAKLHVVHLAADLSNVALQHVDDYQGESKRFIRAVKRTRHDFDKMASQLTNIIDDKSLDIFEMYKQLLESENIGAEIDEFIKQGWNAESALKQVIDAYIIQFEAIEDPYIRERASDIRDLGNRLLYNLHALSHDEQNVPSQFILVAADVTATMVAEYQHLGLQGVVSLSGSKNSHAAILARALGIPAIMGISSLPLTSFENQNAILDGYSGELFVNPSDVLQNEYRHLIEEEGALTAQVKEAQHLATITPDGKSLELQLNAGLSTGFEHSQSAGAVGIGLYRTEIPFMNRSCFPSEEEQTVLYRSVLEAFPKKPVTMRTLDVGGDKALPYFPITEENPFLGWRGIRITLDHPEIFLLQIRAMLKANVATSNLEIMLPMVSSIAEVQEATRLVKQAYFEVANELKEQGQSLPKPKLGIMIEVPSAIYLLPELAKLVDFFSVGSNDLTQYLLAVDRNNPRVAELYSAYHPGVLRALNHIAQQSSELLVPLSICGELASEPAGALLLMAMGYDKLSMNPHNIARIKWVVRHVELRRAKTILEHVLTFSEAKQVHHYMNEQLDNLGLGGFVRAGM